MNLDAATPPAPADAPLLTVGRSLWKIRRCLAWYGLPDGALEALDLGADGTLRASVRDADGSVLVTARLDRRSGRLALDFAG